MGEGGGGKWDGRERSVAVDPEHTLSGRWVLPPGARDSLAGPPRPTVQREINIVLLVFDNTLHMSQVCTSIFGPDNALVSMQHFLPSSERR